MPTYARTSSEKWLHSATMAFNPPSSHTYMAGGLIGVCAVGAKAVLMASVIALQG